MWNRSRRPRASRRRGAVAVEASLALAAVLMLGFAAAQALLLAHAQVRLQAAAAAAARTALAFAEFAPQARSAMARRLHAAAVAELIPAAPRWTALVPGVSPLNHVDRHAWTERAVWAAQMTQVTVCVDTTPADSGAAASDFARAHVEVRYRAPLVLPGSALWQTSTPTSAARVVTAPEFLAALGADLRRWDSAVAQLDTALTGLATRVLRAQRTLAWPLRAGATGLRAC